MMTVDGAAAVGVARTATEIAIEIVAAGVGIINEIRIAIMDLAELIKLFLANAAGLEMTVMDLWTAIHVECALGAKVNGHAGAHNRLLLDFSLTGEQLSLFCLWYLQILKNPHKPVLSTACIQFCIPRRPFVYFCSRYSFSHWYWRKINRKLHTSHLSLHTIQL